MFEPKLISPMLDNYLMGDPISEKPGVRCCPAIERDLQTKCIVKIISTPASQAQLDALLLTGAYPDAQSALQYFHSVAEGITEEAQILQRLAQLEGFFPYSAWQIVPMSEGVGFDVYTLSEYRKTLQKLLKGDNMTHLAAVNLGLDLCTALAVCRRIGHLYVNLKPENIYLSNNNTWKIGDIGFVRLDSLKYTSLPERYRSEYTAPEIEDAFASLNTTLDVYALGLVLYRIFNGNQLPPNLGNPDGDPFVPPDYADYEMAEIILKACDPKPENRWQDPIEMGQALVSYMQRNTVNDTPIVPPSPLVEETPAVETTATTEEEIPEVGQENPIETSEAIEVLKTQADDFSDVLAPSEDETAPEQNEDQLTNIEVSAEVSDILSQADELAEHPTPTMEDAIAECAAQQETEAETTEEATSEEVEDAEPAVIPVIADAPEVPEQENVEEPSEAAPTEEETSETSLEGEPAEPVFEENETAETEASEQEVVEGTTVAASETDQEESSEETGETEDTENEETPKQTHWLRNLLIAAAALALALLAFLFYTNYYLQTIENLDVIKSPDGSVTIQLVTTADESALSVVCADAYGNPRTAQVENGIAVFDNLASGSAYTVTVKISGFHSLIGMTSVAFTTPDQLEILQLDAVTGLEDGSAILSFTTLNQDSEEWCVTYTAEDGTQVEKIFTGHTCTISGLNVGQMYTFQIAPESNIKYTGVTEVKHIASAVILAENVQVMSILDDKLTVQWTAPDGSDVAKWKVHCYNTNGFDKTVETDGTSAVIEEIDPAAPYIVEISAEGMSMTSHTEVPANATTVTNFEANESGNLLTVTWNCANAEVPEKWLLAYSIDGSETQTQVCEAAEFVLKNYVPGAEYTFTLTTEDGTQILGGQMTYQAAKVEKFAAYKVTAANMKFQPCHSPNKAKWSKKDLKATDYTSTFKIGDKISLLASLNDTYNRSDDLITTMFVFRDENGAVVCTSTTQETKWTNMWYQGLCGLNIPEVPTTAGQYKLSIFMNGKLAGEININVTQ